jgi:hypothetical protein
MLWKKITPVELHHYIFFGFRLKQCAGIPRKYTGTLFFFFSITKAAVVYRLL